MVEEVLERSAQRPEFGAAYLETLRPQSISHRDAQATRAGVALGSGDRLIIDGRFSTLGALWRTKYFGKTAATFRLLRLDLPRSLPDPT